MLLILTVVVVAMYMQQNSALSSEHKYELYYPLDESDVDNFHVYQAITNESKHLYPYLAAVISIVCLIGTILGIICLAPE